MDLEDSSFESVKEFLEEEYCDDCGYWSDGFSQSKDVTLVKYADDGNDKIILDRIETKIYYEGSRK